jgi:hypothetical protein
MIPKRRLCSHVHITSVVNMDTIIQRADATMLPDENQGPNILAATLTVTIAALVTIVARLYVRLRMIRNIGCDVSELE